MKKQGSFEILHNIIENVTLVQLMDLDIEWVAENFSTKEPQFYKSPFQSNTEG